MGTPRVAQGRGIPLKPERLQVQVLPRGPFWNAHRTSEPGLFAKQCVPFGKWCKSTAFRQLLQTVCARSSKRTVRFINGVALDECLDPERYRTRVPISVPIAQSTERECPKLQVAGEIPAGDTISRGCGSTAEYGFAKAETTVRLRSPAPISGDVAHQQSARLTCERQRGQHSSSPPFPSA